MNVSYRDRMAVEVERTCVYLDDEIDLCGLLDGGGLKVEY